MDMDNSMVIAGGRGVMVMEKNKIKIKKEI